MSEDRIHRTVSADGTELAGRVHGDGPPLALVEDVTAFADSIGAPVRLAGISGGGMYALGAAARAASVAAVATWEPPVFEAVPTEVAASFQGVLERMGEQYTAGEHVGAVRTFLSFVGNDHELAALEAASEFEYASRYLPIDLQEIEQPLNSEDTSPTDPTVLAKISVPVLLLHGTASKLSSWFRDGIEFAAGHCPTHRSGLSQV